MNCQADWRLKKEINKIFLYLLMKLTLFSHNEYT